MSYSRTKNVYCLGLFALVLASGCASIIPEPPEPSKGHIQTSTEQKPPPVAGDIPKVVKQTPFLPRPASVSEPELETYTVVVYEVPIKELLFALARDASLNVDLHPEVEGLVTINAIDQTLPQILDRVGRQVNMRYALKDGNLIITPDVPYFRTYNIDYVNLSRDSRSTNSVATQVATTGLTDIGDQQFGGGGGGGGSQGQGNFASTSVESISNHRFWGTLTRNILSILGESSTNRSDESLPVSDLVIVHPESGVLSVRATALQHEEIQTFIDSVMVNARRQVLIEATIVEVALSDRYRSGVDWSRVLQKGAGFVLNQQLGTGLPTAEIPFVFKGGYSNISDDGSDQFQVTVDLLKQFGDTKVLSSPKLMVLNNQTAMLKVVDNEVYFTLDVETITSVQGTSNVFSETTVHTVPVGLIMSVTPQISTNSSVIMSVRPTISRITRTVTDPNPALLGSTDQNGINPRIESKIPVVQIREMESVLSVNSGQVAILGGLMQDEVRRDTAGVPLISDIPGVGEAFKNRDNGFLKTELVIFLRPVVMNNPSLDSELADYRPYLDPDYGLQPPRRQRRVFQ